MKTRIILFGLLLYAITLGSASAETLTIQGTVYLDGQLDHSGTSVSLVTLSVPSMTRLGCAVLILLLSLVMVRRKRFVSMAIVMIVLSTGIAVADLSIITSFFGVYELSNPGNDPFAIGTYRIDFEHDGYFSKSILVEIEAQGGPVHIVSPVTLFPLLDPGSLYETDSIVNNLRFIPGTGPSGFLQGSPESEACRNETEPQFTHILTRDLAVMETEVSRQMWSDLMTVKPELPPDPTNTFYGAGMDNPVNSITWNEAVLFANLLSEHNGLTPCYYSNAGHSTLITSANYMSSAIYCDFNASGLRLLTEGEWEYCCRSGTSGPFSVFLSNYDETTCSECSPSVFPALESQATFCANDLTQTDPVALKTPNTWSLCDMHGNISEWCWDFMPESDSPTGYYPEGIVTDYSGPSQGIFRAARGGDWNQRPENVRSAVRGDVFPNRPHYFMGFRLCRTVTGPP